MIGALLGVNDAGELWWYHVTPDGRLSKPYTKEEMQFYRDEFREMIEKIAVMVYERAFNGKDQSTSTVA